MSKIKALAVFFIIITTCLLIGCEKGDEEEELGEIGESGDYTGFLQLKGGEWATYTIPGEGMTKYEYIGTDTYQGVKCSIFEFEAEYGGMKTISQIWIDVNTGNAKLYVMKQDGKVMKLEPQTIPTQPATETPSEYQPGKQIGFETYTTPTGKEVKAAVFKDNNGEYWVSAQVPFGEVKSIYKGEVILELYDYGFSGAHRDISKEEAENAESMFEFPE